jgi:predicted transcriptional regulator
MKNIGRTVRRTLKSEFSTKKNPIPSKLEFLKKLANSFVQHKELKEQHEEVCMKLKRSKDLNKEQQEYIEALEKANEQLMINLGEGTDTPKSQIRSYLQIAEEIGFVVRGPNYQGGLPSLGKKS